MAQVQIPPKQRKALQTFVELSQESTESLLRALRDAKPTMTPAQLARQVAKIVKIPFSDIREILELITSILIAVRTAKRAKQSTAASVATAISAEKLIGKELSSEEVEGLKEKLLRFLELPILEITVKATDVMLQHKNVFVSARVLTDVRPIFSEEDLTPVACVIIHTLEIEAFTDRARVSYFAAMDPNDLRQLRDVIDRAIQKETTLRKTMDRSGLSYLETDQRR